MGDALRQLAGPALSIALRLRHLGCRAPVELLHQAVTVGDERALMVLNVQRSSCAPSNERDSAFRLLEARLSDHPVLGSKEVEIIDSVPDAGTPQPVASAPPVRSAAPPPVASGPPLKVPEDLALP